MEPARASAADGLKSLATVLLILGGAGASQQVLRVSGTGDAIASAAAGAHRDVTLLGPDRGAAVPEHGFGHRRRRLRHRHRRPGWVHRTHAPAPGWI
nr:hypothetical protein StreXyl84_75780 [Streptomyces sp. Xyl84]